MGHLPAAESQTRLYLIPFAEETDSLILLSLVIVFVHGYGKLDFLHRDDSLLLACSALALFLLVKITAVVLDAADGWNSGGRNFDKIEATLAGDSQRFIGRQNSQLLAVLIDDANFAGADALVNANKGLSRTFVECDGAPPEMVRASPRLLYPGAGAGVRTLKSIALPALQMNRPPRSGQPAFWMVQKRDSAAVKLPARTWTRRLAGRRPSSSSGKKFSVSAAVPPRAASASGVCSVIAES